MQLFSVTYSKHTRNFPKKEHVFCSRCCKLEDTSENIHEYFELHILSSYDKFRCIISSIVGPVKNENKY